MKCEETDCDGTCDAVPAVSPLIELSAEQYARILELCRQPQSANEKLRAAYRRAKLKIRGVE